MASIGKISEIPGEVTFTWKIADFFHFLDAINERCASPKFYFSGASWEIRFNPNGETKSPTDGWISLFLARMSCAPPVTIDYSFSIKTDAGKAYTRLCSNVIHKKNVGYGITKFILKSELLQKRLELVPSNVLTIIFTMKNTDEIDVDDSLFSRHQDICDDLHDIYKKAENSDITFKLKNNVNIHVHQIILKSRCPALVCQNQTGEICMDDVDVSTMDNFIQYVYSGDMNNLTKENVFSLCVLASKYDVKNIKDTCVKFICQNLSSDWVCDVIRFADSYKEEEVYQHARRYFSRNADKILKSKNWMTFVKENYDVAIELWKFSQEVKQNEKMVWFGLFRGATVNLCYYNQMEVNIFVNVSKPRF